MLNKTFLLIIFLSTCMCYAQNSWLPARGETILSPSVTHYYTNTNADEGGNKSDFNNNGYYKNYVYKLYFATPIIANKLTLEGNVPYVQGTYEDDFGLQQNSEFGDLELALKMHLKNIGDHHYLIGVFNTVTPMYNKNNEPAVGFDRFGMELKLNLSGNFKWLDINKNFHQIELGVKKFFAGGPYQIKLYASQGYRITNKFIALADLTMFSSRGESFSTSQGDVQLLTDFDMVKTSLSFGYEFSPRFALYAGGFTDVWNRNVAVGRGWQIFSVIKL